MDSLGITDSLVHRMKQPSPIRSGFARALLFALIGVLLPLAGMVAYYANEVRVARRDTPALVQEAWQRYGGRLKHTDLSPHKTSVLLAVEDPAFFRHHGVDLDTPGAGMTTIAQGLVKLLYFPGGFKQGIPKIRQTLIAQYALDALVPKNDQLDLLLNMAYLGSRDGKPVHGFADAAQAYFGKDFAALSDVEFQSLVAMLIAPNQLSPGTPAHAERMRQIDAYLSGAYRPASVLDVEYDGKVRGSPAEEMLMVLLRLITDAKPAGNARQ
jgi:membrane peptidoglycan carboxypeptidase